MNCEMKDDEGQSCNRPSVGAIERRSGGEYRCCEAHGEEARRLGGCVFTTDADAALDERVASIMGLAVGDEVEVDGLVWFRIDAAQLKVHPPGAPDRKTIWVDRADDDVRFALGAGE